MAYNHEAVRETIQRVRGNAQHIAIDSLHTRPIRGLLNGEVLSPYVTARQAGDLASYRDYDSLLHEGIRVDQRMSARFGKKMVRENDKTLLSALWLVSDMAGERYLSNPGAVSEFEIALRLGVCSISAALQERTPVGLMLTNGYELYVKQPNGDALAKYVGESALLANSANDRLEQRMQCIHANKRQLFKKKGSRNEYTPSEDHYRLVHLLSKAVGNLAIQNSLIFIMSDFRDTIAFDGKAPDWVRPLMQLGGHTSDRSNTVIATEVVNPEDFELGDTVGAVIDPLTGKTIPTALVAGLQEKYAIEMHRWTASMRQMFRRNGIGHVTVSVNERNPVACYARQLEKLKYS